MCLFCNSVNYLIEKKSRWDLTKTLYTVMNAGFCKMFFNLQRSTIALFVFDRTYFSDR